jgi:hypothetical protein
MINLIIGTIATLLFILFMIKCIIDDDNEVNKEWEEIMDKAIKDANLNENK